MSKPLHHLGHALYPRPVRHLRAADHDDGQAKLACGVDLGSRARSSRVAGNDPIDATRAHQVKFAGKLERTSRHHDVGLRKRQRAIGWIDEAQDIAVLRLGAERSDVLPADGKKYASWLDRQRRNRGGDIGCLDPVFIQQFAPWRTFKRDQLRAAGSTGRNRVTAHLGREGMGRIDNMRDGLPPNVFGKSTRSAEAADAGRQFLLRRRARASAVGIGRLKPGLRDRFGKQMRLARSTQNEGA